MQTLMEKEENNNQYPRLDDDLAFIGHKDSIIKETA